MQAAGRLAALGRQLRAQPPPAACRPSGDETSAKPELAPPLGAAELPMFVDVGVGGSERAQALEFFESYGFVAIGGKTATGKALYAKAKALMA